MGVFLHHHGSRVGDGRGVHPQGDAQIDQQAEVAVARGQRGDDDAQPHAQHAHLQKHQRRKGDQHPVGLHRRAGLHHEVDPEGGKEQKLHEEVEQFGKHHADGHGQTREVDLAKEVLVGQKGGGTLLEGVGEVGPDEVACHVKEELGHAVRRQGGDAAEHHREHHRVQHGLDEDPRRTQHCLLVQQRHIALDQQEDEVAIAQKFAKVDVEPAVAGADDRVPLLFAFSGCHEGRSLRAQRFSGSGRRFCIIARLCKLCNGKNPVPHARGAGLCSYLLFTPDSRGR